MEQGNAKIQGEESTDNSRLSVSMQVSEHVCPGTYSSLINYAFINRRPEKTKFQTGERCSGLVKQLNGAAQLKPNFF